MNAKDFYEILGIDKEASEDSIKKAYRKVFNMILARCEDSNLYIFHNILLKIMIQKKLVKFCFDRNSNIHKNQISEKKFIKNRFC